MKNIHSVKQCLEGKAALNQHVIVQGWVRTRRDSKAGFSFVNLQDGSCFAPLQLVIPETLENYHHDVLKLTAGCSIQAEGILTNSPGKEQSYEIQVENLRLIGLVDNPETYPIQAKRHSLEYLRTVAHLRPRTNIIAAITRVRHQVSLAIHRFFHERGYFWIHTPIITASDCEGAGEMFRVSTLDLLNLPKNEHGQLDFSQDFFGRETFLTVSGQLNLEAYCLAMSKVYTFGPTFRAENSNTARHLAEFWMVEPEIAFANLDDLCALSQEILQYLCQMLLKDCQEDMDFFNQFVSPGTIARLENIVSAPFEKMTYREAIQALEASKKSFEFPIHWGLDLQSEHERYLAEELCKKPVIVTDYPLAIKSFYMRLNEDNETVAAMDVLAPGIGEIIGGSAREDRLDILDKRMDECNLSKEHYQWYRDLRRYGSVPHVGFGLGLERFVGYVTGVANIRDVIPFPRTPLHADF